MKNRNVAVYSLVSALVLAGLFLGSAASADYRNSKPRIDKIKDITSNSVVLPIRFRPLEDKDVVIRVRVRNAETGKVEIKKFSTDLNDRGNKSVKITGLDSGTKYVFKVKVRKESLKHYSESSNSRNATTK